MRGDEIRVVAAFQDWLESQGWSVELEVEHVDLVAIRDDQRIYAEAKGRTASPGLDIDTMFGQLLRRMRPGDSAARYAVVVPQNALAAALRVPKEIRGMLSVEVYAVDDAGGVTRHE